MALGLDREDAARPDQNVVDVAGTERDVVERELAKVRELIEELAYLALTRCTLEPAIDLWVEAPLGAYIEPLRPIRVG